MKKNLLIIFFCFPLMVFASEIRFNSIFGDHMILQRDKPIKIWGMAKPNSMIIVTVNNNKFKTKSLKDSTWQVISKSYSANQVLKISAKCGNETKTINDVLMGDVWLCGGQSNMEWKVFESKNSDFEIKNANYPNIRIVTIDYFKSFKKEKDAPNLGWKPAIGQNIASFSAVGYFFGRKVFQETGVPIGLISSNWGGSNCETWTGLEFIKNIPYMKPKVDLILKNSHNCVKIDSINKKEEEQFTQKYIQNDSGLINKWYEVKFDDSKWQTVKLPDTNQSFKKAVWFRKKFMSTNDFKDKNFYIRLGKVGDFDVVYLNGKKVASCYKSAEWRTYKIDKSNVLSSDSNVISVLVLSNGSLKSGMKEIDLKKFAISEDRYIIRNSDISLCGNWKTKISTNLDTIIAPKIISTDINVYPSVAYNAMIAPLANLELKGVIWYQGETNTPRAFEYRTNLPLMIASWRKTFSNPILPFIQVQIANFRKVTENPVASEWAELREAQYLTSINVANVGLATAVDLGEGDNIHPTNKQDVGLRLGYVALNMVYGKTQFDKSNPAMSKVDIKSNIAIISFKDYQEKLVLKSKYGYLTGFAIAGSDQKFYWAKGILNADNSVTISSDKVADIKSVRYGWSDNPEDISLFSTIGLPVLPFRTDSWIENTRNEIYK